MAARGLLCVVALLAWCGAAQQDPCQPAMDAWCNLDTDCLDVMEHNHFRLPLVALFDTEQGNATRAWRCYSPSSLTPDRRQYTNGSAYCTRPDLMFVRDQCKANISFTPVFGPGMLGYPCIRIPAVVLTPANVLLAFAEVGVSL